MAKRILMVDDCRLTRSIVRDMLESAGYEVCIASSGTEADAFVFSDSPPDLILMDVVMPEQTGDQKVQHLKLQRGSRHIPVLLVSTRQEAELAESARQCGADGYLRKPLSQHRLLEKLSEYL